MQRQNASPLFAGSRYNVLQASRAAAALLVLLFHLNESVFNLPKYWPQSPFGHAFRFGNSGVDFFFVLSGFIIYAAHSSDIGEPTRVLQFFWKRFRRIYPTYWVVLAFLLAAMSFIPGLGTGEEARHEVIANSILLVYVFPTVTSVLVPSWTLYHEVMFYCLFAVLIFNRRIGSAFLILWFIAAIAGLYYSPEGRAGALVKPIHLCFAMGMAAAWNVSSRRVKAPAALCAVGITLFAAAGLEAVRVAQEADGLIAIAYGLGSTIFIIGAVELERSGQVMVPRLLVFLGNASYSIYLVHLAALSALAKIAFHVVGDTHPALAVPLFVGLATGATLAGCVFYMAVERPLLSWMSRSRRRVAAAAPLVETL